MLNDGIKGWLVVNDIHRRTIKKILSFIYIAIDS